MHVYRATYLCKYTMPLSALVPPPRNSSASRRPHHTYNPPFCHAVAVCACVACCRVSPPLARGLPRMHCATLRQEREDRPRRAPRPRSSAQPAHIRRDPHPPFRPRRLGVVCGTALAAGRHPALVIAVPPTPGGHVAVARTRGGGRVPCKSGPRVGGASGWLLRAGRDKKVLDGAASARAQRSPIHISEAGVCPRRRASVPVRARPYGRAAISARRSL